MNNNIDEALSAALEQAQQLLMHAASHLAGDLEAEQIQLYDLAFCQAEIYAARCLRTRATNVPEAQKDLCCRAADYFTAEVIEQTFQKLARRTQQLWLRTERFAGFRGDSKRARPTRNR